MKGILKLSLIMLLIIMCWAGVVYAATSCNISLETAKSEFNKNDEFTVDVKLSNIQSERGIIALEANLEYDKESLTLVSMEGQNKWSSPVKDLSYNEATGKLVIDKTGLAQSDEVILKLTFKVKENSKKNLMIALSNIRVSDATVPTEVKTAYKNITIKEGQDNNVPTPPGEDNNNPTIPPVEENPSNPSTPDQNTVQIPQTNTTNTTNTTANGNLPQTGYDNRMLILFIVVAVVSVVALYIKVRKDNKEIGK